MNIKTKNFICLIFIAIISINSSIAEDLDVNYTLFIKIFGAEIKIGQINSNMKINKDKYQLFFTLESEKLINFIRPIDGNGNVYGKIDNLTLMPTNYEYNYIKKKIIKNTKIQFNNSNVTASITIPSFDKSKLSPVNNDTLVNVIDPITAIIYLGDYELNKKCTVNYRIYDGKRRYDLRYTKLFNKDGYKICRLTQDRIGGFKLKDKQDSAFEPAQEIDTYFKKINDKYFLKKIISKNKLTNIFIDVNYN